MKKLITLLLAVSVLISFSGCDSGHDEEENIAEGSQPERASEAVTETVAVTSGGREASYEEEPPKRPEPEERQWNIVNVSAGNEFIDFEYLMDVSSVKERSRVEDVAELAEKAVSEDKAYISDIEAMKKDCPEKLSGYEKRRGTLNPQFAQCFTYDYDCNGTKESVVLVEALSSFGENRENFAEYVVFVGNDKSVKVLGKYTGVYWADMLDYGNFKHLVLNGRKNYWAKSDTVIVGMKDKTAKVLYDFTNEEQTGVYKSGCFITVTGWEKRGDFMYFDTVAGEYRVVIGERCNIDDVFAMDTSKSLMSNLIGAYEDESRYLVVERFGDNHYVFSTDERSDGSPYTYKNGAFTYGGYGAISGNSNNLNAVKSLDIDRAISEMRKPDKNPLDAAACLEAEFIDFEYTYAKGAVRSRSKFEEIADAAEKAVAEFEEYQGTLDFLRETFYEAKEYFSGNPEIEPEFLMTYTDDFDGDGMSENFVLVDALPEFPEILVYLVYVDRSNNAAVVNEFYNLGEIKMIDYGYCKQLIIHGHGTMGATEGITITGLVNGKPVELYAFRGDFNKYGCFINASGWQGMGDFMYFDRMDMEYKSVTGKLLDIDEVFALDKTGSLDIKREDYWDVRLFGGKYYNFSMGLIDTDGVTYTYENGRFTREDNMGIRRSEIAGCAGTSIEDVDIDKALAEMKKPYCESKYKEVSSGNEFIDFEYIKDYKGETDRTKVKAIAEAAEKAVREIDENLSVSFFSNLEWIRNVEGFNPEFYKSFTEDFNGDGIKESFVVVDGLPDKDPELKNCYSAFLVFVDDKNNAKIINYFEYLYDVSLLDYGKSKHLVIENCGGIGAGQHSAIVGVRNQKPVNFYDFRGAYEKYGCFLQAGGWMGSGDFMYFDTVAGEYRPITGVPLNIDEAFAMDKCKSLDIKREDYLDVRLFGGRYYNFSMGPMDSYGITYTYENGKFIKADGMGIRRSDGEYYPQSMNIVRDVDIDKALAEMKKPH